MKDIEISGRPDSNHEFRNQSTPLPATEKPKPQEKPKVTFPVGPIIIENGSKTPEGKTKGPKKIKGQIKLPW